MDSATSPGDGQRTSSASADFLLSSWPQLMLPQPLDSQTAKLFRPDPFYGANDTPPLTEDEMDEDLMELGVNQFNRFVMVEISLTLLMFSDGDREHLMFTDDLEIGKSWPAMVWNQSRREQQQQQLQEVQEWDNGERSLMERRNSFTV